MTRVVSIVEFKRAQAGPTLVLVDLHAGTSGVERGPRSPEMACMLDNCRAILSAARSRRLPIAFVRQVPAAGAWCEQRHYPSWLEGFAPTRADMVFDRQAPSCYASSEFADMAAHSNGQFVLAGLFGETSCLSTLVEAYHRGHRVTYLLDASASRGSGEISASDMHSAVARLAALYGDVALTRSWLSGATVTLGAAR